MTAEAWKSFVLLVLFDAAALGFCHVWIISAGQPGIFYWLWHRPDWFWPLIAVNLLYLVVLGLHLGWGKIDRDH